MIMEILYGSITPMICAFYCRGIVQPDCSDSAADSWRPVVRYSLPDALSTKVIRRYFELRREGFNPRSAWFYSLCECGCFDAVEAGM